MSKKTAVTWMIDKIINKQNGTFDGFPVLSLDEIFEQAKEMEKEQSQNYAEFAIKCDRKGMKILEFDSYINL
jgi:tRNA(Ser,Leu) C12 N-acetylase TAN1